VVVATLKSDNLTPVVLRGFEFLLLETITFQGGQHPHGKKIGPISPQITTIGEQKVPLSVTLYGGTQHKIELGCGLPPNHTTSSVISGTHIAVSYKTLIRAVLDFMAPLEMELPITTTNWPRHVSGELMRYLICTIVCNPS